jgi:Methyltransferase FkbM domain
VKAPIFTMPFGLADEEKTAFIHVPDGRFEFGSLAQPVELQQLLPEMRIARYECRFMSLDGFLRSRDGLVADFWKIDVEGAELLVLIGASHHFAAGNRPLILAEVYAPWEQRCGYGPWEFLAPLLRLGYQFVFLCRSGLIEHSPSESAPFPPEFEHGYNVVAHVPERHAERMPGLERLRFGTGAHCPSPRAFIRIVPCPGRPPVRMSPTNGVMSRTGVPGKEIAERTASRCPR